MLTQSDHPPGLYPARHSVLLQPEALFQLYSYAFFYVSQYL
jgi:hypothetical protein